MGAAAYRRGSASITRQLEQEQRPQEFAMMDDLNSLTKYADAGTPLGPIQFVWARGVWWAECPTSGFGFWYTTLRAAIRRWHVRIIAYDRGVWYAVPDQTTPESTLDALYARVFRATDRAS